MIRDKHYKLVYRIHASSEFYDLEKDPDETTNEIANPAYQDVISQMKLQILDWYQDTCDVVPYKTDDRFSHKMIWEKVKMLCPEGYEKDVKMKIEQGMGLFQVQDYCKKIADNH